MWKPLPAAPGLRVAAPLVAVQGLTGVIYTVGFVIEAIRLGATGPSAVSSGSGEVILGLLFTLVSLGLLWSAVGLWRERRWARAPIVLIEIILGIVGFQQATNGGIPTWIRVVFGALCVIAAVILVCVFLPTTTARFNRAPEPGR